MQEHYCYWDTNKRTQVYAPCGRRLKYYGKLPHPLIPEFDGNASHFSVTCVDCKKTKVFKFISFWYWVRWRKY